MKKALLGLVKRDTTGPAGADHALPAGERFAAEIREAAGHFDAGRPQPSEEICRRILASDADHPKALNLLGIISFSGGRQEEGVRLLKRAVAVQPDFASAQANLGRALSSLGQLDEAEHCFRRTVELDPGSPGAYNTLGALLGDQKRMAQAEVCYRKALALRPDFADCHANLGIALVAQERLAESLDSFRSAIALNPAHPVRSNLGNALLSCGKLEEAAALYRDLPFTSRALAQGHSNVLLALNYQPGLSRERIFEEHLHWDLLHGLPGRGSMAPPGNERSPDRALRIGYLSADFGRHPVGYFLSPVLPAHDREHFQIYCFSERSEEDDLTVRLRRSSDFWFVTKGTSDHDLAELIRAKGIDILVDLSGHTGNNRLTAFAHKPAPLQMTWAGYVGSTGLSAMDYLISDQMESPEGAEKFCREKIIRLPYGYLCYEPPGYAPPVTALPARGNGFVTFGCYNNPEKITPQVVALWAELLGKLPTARLKLRFRNYEKGEVRERYLALFAAGGIDCSRVELSGWLPHLELLRSYQEIDIALDPFPYSGGLTTMEALWMGVPVVTLGGERFCSRHTLSHLTAVGLPELAADDRDGYLAIAMQLARDTERLTALRSGLRAKLAGSPLCDGAGFTRDLERAFRAAWHTWCQG